MTNFESLRELVQQAMPGQLEAFDRLAFRLRRFQHDDDLILFIEAAGFVALLAHQVPRTILESNATYRATLETLKATLANLDTKALSEKLSAALLQSIEQSVQTRGEIAASAKTLKEISAQYRAEVRQFNRLRFSRAVGLAWLSAFLVFGTLYFVGWESHRHFLDAQAKRQLAATLDAARQLQNNGVELKVIRDNDTIYLVIPAASKAYLSDRGEGVIAIQPP